jgi:hypothetical protein
MGDMVLSWFVDNSGLGQLLDPAAKRGEIHHAGMPGGDLAIIEQEQGGYALDPELPGNRGLGVDIDLHESAHPGRTAPDVAQFRLRVSSFERSACSEIP